MRLGLGLDLVGTRVLPSTDHVSLGATLKKTTAIFTIKNTNHAALSATLKKTTASFTVKNTDHVALSATLKKTVASFAVQAFHPSSLSWQLRMEADTGVTVTGSGISAWNDQSGTGDSNKNASQATDAQRPPLNTSDAAYNNQKVMSFAAASNQYLWANGNYVTPIAAPYTIFVVGEDTSSSDINGAVMADTANGNPRIFRITSRWSCIADGSTYIQAIGHDTTTPSVACWVINGASSRVYVNGLSTSGTGSQTAPATIKRTVYGSSTGRVTGINGKLACVFVYSGDMPDADRINMTNWLGRKYGMSIAA